MEQMNYKRRHNIKIDSQQTRELSLFLSFVWEESLDNEGWYEIKGMGGRYFISSFGRVLSLCFDGYKLLRPFVCGDGYYYVDLRKDGKDYKCRINRLVAEAFIENPNGKPIVHHKDLDRKNNSASNLQWVTEAEHTAIHNKIRAEKKKEKLFTANENLLS